MSKLVASSVAACARAKGVMAETKETENNIPTLEETVSSAIALADGVFYVVLAALPWANCGVIAACAPDNHSAKLSEFIRECESWMNTRSEVRDAVWMHRPDAEITATLHDWNAVELNPNILQLWELVAGLQHPTGSSGSEGEEGSLSRSWIVAFSTSIPNPLGTKKGPHHETLAAVAPVSIKERELEAMAISWMSPQKDEQEGSGTNARGADEESKNRIPDHAKWDLDCTTRAFQLLTTPDGPVARA